MKDWVLSHEGDKWTVKLDVRRLGGHLHTTFRSWSVTLAAWVRLVISRLVVVSVLSLDFHGRVRIARTMFIPGVVHGFEASLLASSLRKLRSSISMVVWSCRKPLASAGAVLSLLDGPQGCDPAYCVVWFRFRMIRRYLAHRTFEVGSVYRLLDVVTEGCPGHGPIHLLVSSAAADVRFRWDSGVLGWDRPGLLALSNFPGSIQHFRSALLGAWKDKVAADLCSGRVCSLVGSGIVSFWQGSGVSQFHAGSVVVLMVMVTFFSERTFHPLVEIRENPEFHDLMSMDKEHWP